MTRLFCILLTLLLSLSGPAIGEYSDFGRWGIAAKGTAGAADDIYVIGRQVDTAVAKDWAVKRVSPRLIKF